MERLSFDSASRYDSLEAAIHLARYSLVRPMCAGRRVLDIACGEGYGSYLMSQWGASSVHGMDVSEEAVAQAQRLFGASAEFSAGDAEQADRLFPAGSFDLIVSLETIEHVADPQRFLAVLKGLVCAKGAIVISCPNDWWYYPQADSGNPYHRRKYTFEEFRALAEHTLGQARQWVLGGPIAGFANTPMQSRLEALDTDSQRRMLEALEIRNAVAVPADVGKGPTASDASYFVGFWGEFSAEALAPSLAAVPLGMNVFRDGIFSAWGPERVPALMQRVEELEAQLNFAEQARAQAARLADEHDARRGEAERDLRHARLRVEALRAEIELMLENVSRLRSQTEQLRAEQSQLHARVESLNQEVASMHVPAARYMRLRSAIPAPLRRTALALYRGLRRDA